MSAAQSIGLDIFVYTFAICFFLREIRKAIDRRTDVERKAARRG